MKQRLALVCWWFGAIVAGLLLGVGCVALFNGRDGGAVFGMCAVSAVVVAAPAWAIAFVLGGSFWRPPTRATVEPGARSS